jgi:hypothetical protein
MGGNSSEVKESSEENRKQAYYSYDALTAGDWGVLSEYLEILTPLKEATARLEGRAIQGNYFNSY